MLERFHLLLGDGNDLVRGGALDDYVEAGGGDDVLSGGLGDDHLYGEAGNDLFEHVGGSDQFYGGSGNDMVAISAAADAVSLSFFDAADQQIGITFSMVDSTPGFAEFASIYGINTAQYTLLEHGSASLRYEGMR